MSYMRSLSSGVPTATTPGPDIRRSAACTGDGGDGWGARVPGSSGRRRSVGSWRVLEGDCRQVLATLPAESVQTCVTSPPYWGLRDYGHPGQMGLEQTPAEYVEQMVSVFREVRRVLRDDGTLWLNLGDSYATSGVKV